MWQQSSKVVNPFDALVKQHRLANRNQMLECDSTEDLRLEKLLREHKDKAKRRQNEKKQLEQKKFEELTNDRIDRMENLMKMIAASLEGMREEQRSLNLKIQDMNFQTNRRSFDFRNFDKDFRLSRGERDFIDE